MQRTLKVLALTSNIPAIELDKFSQIKEQEADEFQKLWNRTWERDTQHVVHLSQNLIKA